MRAVRVFGAIYLAAVLGLTMWPELGHTGVSSWAHRVVNWLGNHGIHTSVSGLEAISNVLMFVPFGLLGVAILMDLPRLRSLNTGLLGDALKIALLGAALSGLIETVQRLIPGRVTSFDDFWRNTLGAVIGAALAALYFHLRGRDHSADVSPDDAESGFVRTP